MFFKEIKDLQRNAFGFYKGDIIKIYRRRNSRFSKQGVTKSWFSGNLRTVSESVSLSRFHLTSGRETIKSSWF